MRDFATAGRAKPIGTIFTLGFLAIIVFTLMPLASALGASWVASSHGCVLNEASVHPCIIEGTDYGNTLLNFMMMGWFMLFTLPLGALAFFVWFVALIVVLMRRRNVMDRRAAS